MESRAAATQQDASHTLNVSALVAYDGTGFAGFQYQANAASVQQVLEQALDVVTRWRSRVSGAGRTDAGVHANGQVVGVSLAWEHGLARLQRAWNANLPPSVTVRHVREVPERFHPRFSAISRTYRYSVRCYSGETPYLAPYRSPLTDRYAFYLRGTLDVEAMQVAAAVLIGNHDFGTFGQPPRGENAVRTVHSAAWHVVEEAVAPFDPYPGRQLIFTITANAFLRQMVRCLVGSLLAVGKGKWTTQQFADAFRAQDRSRSAPPAPANGLVLERVTYPGDLDALVHGN